MKKTVSKKTSRIAVIGAGKMATAITVSLVSKGVPASSILAYDVSPVAAKKFTADTPAYALAAVVKGFVPQWPVAERFAATLPEAASKKPYAVSFFSISSR